MPKAGKCTKRSARKCSPTSERITAKLKTEDTEPELPSSSGSTVIAYQPAQPVHFDELNRLWPADIRIPSAVSRRAWAAARNLNPANIHSWWTRRRKVAKKLKIKIPQETYELEVGCPPVIPVSSRAMTVKKEEEESEKDQAAVLAAFLPNSSSSTAMDCISATTRSAENIPLEKSTPIEKDLVISSSDAHILTSDDDYGHFSPLDSSGTTLVDDLEHVGAQSIDETGKNCAYMRTSSPEVLSPSPFRPLYLQFSLESSPLPPNSPLPPSSPPVGSSSPALFPSESLIDQLGTVGDELSMTLTSASQREFSEAQTHSQTRADRDTLWHSFALLETAGYYPADLLPLTSHQTRIPLSACASTPVLDIRMLKANDSDGGTALEDNGNGSRSRKPLDDDALVSNGKFTFDSELNQELHTRYLNLNPEDAPWCLDGFRISCDGSLVGLCSFCYSYPTLLTQS